MKNINEKIYIKHKTDCYCLMRRGILDHSFWVFVFPFHISIERQIIQIGIPVR